MNAYFLNHVETKLFFNLKEIWEKKIPFYYLAILIMGCQGHNSTHLSHSHHSNINLDGNLLYNELDQTLWTYFKAVYLVEQDFSDDIKLTVSYHTWNTQEISDLSALFLCFTYLFYINTKYCTVVTAEKPPQLFCYLLTDFCRSDRLQLQDMA